jgi:molybdopterin/thiamine biosynthesis adenylyltransferase
MKKSLFFKRLPKHLRPAKLHRKIVTIIGLGSGGSQIAVHLGRLGITLVLVDRPGERLEEHNIFRHVLGYDSLGKSKHTELKRHIANLNPETRVTCVDLDVTASAQEFEALVRRSKPDLIVVATDNAQSRHAIDAVAVRQGIPTVGAGVYDGGIGGEVYLTRPGAACYGCLAAAMNLEKVPAPKPGNLDYNNLNLDEVRSTCALNLDIEQMALIQARVALGLLLNDSQLAGLPLEVNFIVFNNHGMPAPFARPLHAEYFHLQRDPDCLTCGRPTPAAASEVDRILATL